MIPKVGCALSKDDALYAVPLLILFSTLLSFWAQPQVNPMNKLKAVNSINQPK